MEKPTLYCSKCSAPLHFKLPRNWVGRNVLFFLPIKRYFCAKCLEKRYFWMTDHEAQKYWV